MNRSHREVSQNTLVYPGLVYPFLKREIEKTHYSFLKFHPLKTSFQKMQFIFKISPSLGFFHPKFTHSIIGVLIVHEPY